jgi:hypothetical protein
MPSLATPAKQLDRNQFEISIFGPGVGECIVLHVGGGDWIIVDSCIDRQSGNPVALDYLSSLNVPSDGVKLIVVTHWHNDHCQGMSRLIESYPAAKLVLSSALRTNEFKQFIAASRMEEGIGINELRRALDALLASPAARERRIFAAADRVLFSSTDTKITSLSPSDRTFGRSFLEIAELVLPRQQRRRMAAHSENDVAVVLWIELGNDLRILLGSDLERSADPDRGWLAILNSAVRPSGRASVFKVSHHGSRNADEERIWSEMLVQNPWSVMTPYRSGVKPLPSADDLQRILSRTDKLYLAAKSQAPKPGLNRTVERVARGIATSLVRLDGRMGHIRLRSDGTSLGVELFGRAHRVLD